jgi:cell division septum initiation protein DivIVA
MDITRLIEENENLKTEIIELKEQLKKYTYGNSHKRYYEKNKERVKEGGANYLKKLKEENPDKLKEYRRNAYLKKKNMLNEDIL